MPRRRLSDEVYAARLLEQRIKRGQRKVSPLPPPIPIGKYPPPAKIEFRPQVPIDFHELIRRWPGEVVELCCKRIPEDLSEVEARRWAWDASDEFAIHEGCRFSLRRAMHYAYTLRNNLVFWEGEWSGEPFLLESWEIECDLRIFGWIRPSEKHSGRWVRRFTKASTWVAKKNGKSPRGAAHCVYVWRFDGPWKDEWGPTIGGGNHVYCVAKNGVQAARVWNHAKNMIEASPMLGRELDESVIVKNEARCRLEYLPKHSILGVVTGDNQRARDAAEGLNARLICCDEAHVVDDRMVEVTKDAGASHEDYLWSQISTYGAGEGYGKKDLDYGRDVASGKVKNASYFFKTYEAPQDVSEADCGREEIWQMANPNLGNTVSIRQLRDAYAECKDDPPQFAAFKQRRLNIWQRGFSPLVSFDRWMGCAATIGWETIKDVVGGVGFDLSEGEDWASCAVAWHTADGLSVWVKIWTTEDWLEENGHRAPFLLWVEEGHITVHEGGSLDFEIVQAEILEIIKHTRARGVGYDKTYGAQLGQNILRKNPRLVVGKFSQSVENYASGTSRLKAAVKTGTLRHPGNPALDWQIGHVMGKQLGKFEKPIKPERDGTVIQHLKIDSVQAIVMAIHVDSQLPERHEPWVGRV